VLQLSDVNEKFSGEVTSGAHYRCHNTIKLKACFQALNEKYKRTETTKRKPVKIFTFSLTSEKGHQMVTITTLPILRAIVPKNTSRNSEKLWQDFFASCCYNLEFFLNWTSISEKA